MLFFISEDPCKSVANNFLNCTKNIGLTPEHFARTFTFALTNKSVPALAALRTKSQDFTRTQRQRAMKSVEWKTYRTRFLVKAKQLSSSLSFTDHLGRQHCGRKGDYLVESCDGVLSIAPRQIFEDIYVPMGLIPVPSEKLDHESAVTDVKELRFEPLQIERIKTTFTDNQHRRTSTLEKMSRVRKTPQSVRPAAARLNLV